MSEPAVSEAPRHPDRLAALDGLRGLAILFVAWYHIWLVTWCGPTLPFAPSLDLTPLPATGTLGVDIFFFVSGFCLFYPYAQTLFDGRPKQTLGDYTWRRFIKIVPSYVLLMLALVSFGWASGVNNVGDAIREIAIHLTFLHSWFPNSYGSIAGVLWSLAVEVQFYVLFPLLCWGAMRRPLIVFPLMFVAALGYREYIAHVDPNYIGQGINQVFGVLDLFGSGMLAAYLYRYIPAKRPEMLRGRADWTIAAVLATIALFWSFFNAYEHNSLPNWQELWRIEHRTLFALILCVTALASLFAFPLWQRILGNRILIFLSAISYNLYLWHQVVSLQLDRFHIPRASTPTSHDDPTWRILAFGTDVVASIAVASLITYLFERPLLRTKPRDYARFRRIGARATR